MGRWTATKVPMRMLCFCSEVKDVFARLESEEAIIETEMAELASKMQAAKTTLSRSKADLEDHTQDKHEEFAALGGAGAGDKSSSKATGNSGGGLSGNLFAKAGDQGAPSVGSASPSPGKKAAAPKIK